MGMSFNSCDEITTLCIALAFGIAFHFRVYENTLKSRVYTKSLNRYSLDELIIINHKTLPFRHIS